MATEEAPRIGVFVCHCGHNIAGTVDVERVAETADHYPNVEFATHFMFMCSDSGQQLIRDKIKEFSLNRVVVASCSPRMHEPTFRRVVEEADVNRYCFEQVNLREHVSWCHMKEPEAATEKAMDLIRMSVARAALLEPLEVKTVSVEPHTLVVGGGVAGLRAAIDIDSRGFKVTLVEREPELGGNLAKLSTLFQDNEKASDVIERMVMAARVSKNLTIMTDSEVVDVEGYIGNFDVTVKNNATDKTEKLRVGAIIVATGFQSWVPEGIPPYGMSPDVITLAQLEEMKRDNKVLCPSSGKLPKKVMFVGCVGSRQPGVQGHEHCSRYCCTAMVKAAADMTEIGDDILILYDDIRTFGKGHEEVHRSAHEKFVIFSRFDRTKPAKTTVADGALSVKWRDILSGDDLEFHPDLLVLATAMMPPEGVEKVSQLFSLTRSADGFFNEEHIKLAPLTTHTAGVMIAGAAQSAKDSTDSTTQASGAAAKATSLMARGEVEIESTVAHVLEELCGSCHTCATACPYGAISMDTSKKPEIAVVTEAECHGCGTCAAGCPSSAIIMRHSTDEQITAMVEAFLMPPPVPGGGDS